jgi:hypothetical protein
MSRSIPVTAGTPSNDLASWSSRIAPPVSGGRPDSRRSACPVVVVLGLVYGYVRTATSTRGVRHGSSGEALEKPDFDPSYAVDFWDLTNRQDWGACESVQRGLRSPHSRPGPLAPDEDGVYQFVTRVARAWHTPRV